MQLNNCSIKFPCVIAWEEVRKKIMENNRNENGFVVFSEKRKLKKSKHNTLFNPTKKDKTMGLSMYKSKKIMGYDPLFKIIPVTREFIK